MNSTRDSLFLNADANVHWIICIQTPPLYLFGFGVCIFQVCVFGIFFFFFKSSACCTIHGTRTMNSAIKHMNNNQSSNSNFFIVFNFQFLIFKEIAHFTLSYCKVFWKDIYCEVDWVWKFWLVCCWKFWCALEHP